MDFIIAVPIAHVSSIATRTVTVHDLPTNLILLASLVAFTSRIMDAFVLDVEGPTSPTCLHPMIAQPTTNLILIFFSI